MNTNTENPPPPGSGVGLDSPAYFNKRQAARHLNVSTRTIDALMRARKIPYIKLTCKLVRFPKAELDAYLGQHFRIKAVGE